MTAASIEIVEVAPRDGFQPIAPWIPTETKIAFVQRLAAAGLRRIEIGSFVSPTAIPQLRDTAELIEAAAAMPGLRPQVLVPTARRAREAVAAGARFLVYVLSASEAHNQSNVRRSVAESVEDYARMIDEVPGEIEVRINLATAFDCPFDGRMAVGPVLELLGRLAALRHDVEICLCDTTGRATPDHVAQLSAAAAACCPQVATWAYHAHDTYGLGLATTYAAYREGCGSSTPRRADWAAAPLHLARRAMWRPRMSSGCSSAWGSAPAWTSMPCSRWRWTSRRYRVPQPAAGRVTRCSRAAPSNKATNTKRSVP